jgi:hypothetical protein
VRVVAGRKIAQSRTQHRNTPHAASDEVAVQKCIPSAWRARRRGITRPTSVGHEAAGAVARPADEAQSCPGWRGETERPVW